MAIKALETLKDIPQWICYKNEVKTEGEKPAKVPKNPHTGQSGSSTNSQAWGTFMDAVRGKKRHNMSGLGWVFTKEVGILGIDLDGCIDEAGQVKNWADEIIKALDSYTEISPSGRGLHIFVYGKIPKALGPAPGSKIEVYAEGRYFTMTGKQLPSSSDEIGQRQAAITSIWEAESERRLQESRPRPKGDSSTPSPVSPAVKLKAYTEKAYLDEIATLSMATAGNRNDALNRAAFNLGQFIEAGLLGQTEIEITLFNLATQLGLGDREASATIRSGINSGINNPRTNWPTDDPKDPPVQPAQIPPPLPPNDLVYHKAVAPHLDTLFSRWGLTEETVETFKVGYCDACPTSTYSDSFTAPYYLGGNLVDIRHRLLSPNGQGRYRPEVDDHPEHLFNLAAVGLEDWLILVNREFNTMLLGQVDLPAVGLPSTFKRSWLSSLEDQKKIFIALDPGQDEAARSIGRLLTGAGVDARVCSLPFSPVDMLVRYGCSLGDFSMFIEQGWGM